jgi:hypothetical protein
MAIHSFGFTPTCASAAASATEFEMFIEHLDLILQCEAEILLEQELFYCQPSFAWSSWPYVAGDGPLCLGYLILGWKNGILTETCPLCSGCMLVTSFSGSPLSGSISSAGICKDCRNTAVLKGPANKPIAGKISFICELRKSHPNGSTEWTQYEGFNFSWGGTGLIPAVKQRLVHNSNVVPLTLEGVLKAVGKKE